MSDNFDKDDPSYADTEPVDIKDLYETGSLLQKVSHLENRLLESVISVAKKNEGTSVGEDLSSIFESNYTLIRNLSRALVARIGKGATTTTAGIMAVCSEGLTLKQIYELESVKLLFAQNVMELIPDDEFFTKRPEVLKFVTALSIRAAKGEKINFDAEEFYKEFPELQEYQIAFAKEVNKMLNKGFAKNSITKPLKNLGKKVLDLAGITFDSVSPAELNNPNIIKLEHLIQMHLDAVYGAANYVNEKTEANKKLGDFSALRDFVIESLTQRYEAVMMDAEKKRPQNIDELVAKRTDEIMIKVNMSLLGFDLALVDEDVKNYLLDEKGFNTFKQAVEVSASLTGLFNDLGSDILRLGHEDMEKIVRIFKEINPNAENLEEIFAPENFKEYCEVNKSSGKTLDQLRAEFDKRKLPFDEKLEFWSHFRCLLKDYTKGEGNVTRFFEDLESQIGLINILRDFSQQLEFKLRELTQNMPQHLKDIVINNALYHAIIYSINGGDYYNENNKEVVNYILNILHHYPPNWRLYDGPTEQ